MFGAGIRGEDNEIPQDSLKYVAHKEIEVIEKMLFDLSYNAGDNRLASGDYMSDEVDKIRNKLSTVKALFS